MDATQQSDETSADQPAMTTVQVTTADRDRIEQIKWAIRGTMADAVHYLLDIYDAAPVTLRRLRGD